MSGLGNIIYYEIEQEKQRKKDFEALHKMKELEKRFEIEREKIIEKTTVIRTKYVKKHGK